MHDQTISYAKVRELTEDPAMPRGMAAAIEYAVRDINYHDEQILKGSQRVGHIAERVAKYVKQGANLNELGEFQNAAQEVDRHIALRHAAWQQLSMLLEGKTGQLATARFVQHLTEVHNLMAPLDPGDLSSLRAQHAIAMDQNPAEATKPCYDFV
jgi:hypothetical protein